MESRTKRLVVGTVLGCSLVSLILIGAVVWLGIRLLGLPDSLGAAGGIQAELTAAPTLSVAPGDASRQGSSADPRPFTQQSLADLYAQTAPGVVSIRVAVERMGRSGQGAGSGFILDDAGHIVTNNHVVAQADLITVVFHDGYEAQARIVGTDAYSDLAVVKVDEMAETAHPLPLGDSDAARAGDWVVAIGNPFSQSSSMSVGIVSAVGRTIPSGVLQFGIPEAIQTDAAINPGNSGGPLIDMQGRVIGVNAQIATGGARASAGVGFAIPSTVVQRVIPELIAQGEYTWAWLGVSGGDIGLGLMRANDLPSQRGAYIHEIIPDGPADRAGLRGSTGSVRIEGFEVFTGGDVITEVNGVPVAGFGELLARITAGRPGDDLELGVVRDGERIQVTVTLDERPSTSGGS